MKILSWANIQSNLRHSSNELNDRNLSKVGQNRNNTHTANFISRKGGNKWKKWIKWWIHRNLSAHPYTGNRLQFIIANCMYIRVCVCVCFRLAVKVRTYYPLHLSILVQLNLMPFFLSPFPFLHINFVYLIDFFVQILVFKCFSRFFFSLNP